MAQMFDIIYPNNDRIGLDGGLNTKFDRQWLADNETPECLNVVYGQNSVETRGGSDLVNTASVGSFACDGLYTRHDSDGSETMTAWFDGTLYDLQGTSFISVTSAKSIFTAGTRIYSAEYENYIFFQNGYNPQYKWNGAEFTRGGIYPPTTTMTAATAPTGANLTGDYQYLVTYVNSNLVESDISPVTGTITVSTQDVRLTSIPVAPQSFGVNSRRLYRTEASGTVYYRLATISDNTTTTYDDGVDDGDLGLAAPTDQGYIPTTAKAIIYQQGRMFTIDSADNLVKYSEIGNPYVFKSTNFIRIGDTSGDIPKTLGVHDNSIIINCKRYTWLLYMPTTDDTGWVQIRIKSDLGSRSHFGLFNYNNKLMFPAMQNDKFVGFAAISGQSIEPDATLLTVGTTGSDLKSNMIEPDMFNIVENQVENISSIVFKNRAYISVTYSAGSTNNRIYVFDYSYENLNKNKRFAWSIWEGINTAQFTVYDGKLYAGCSEEVGEVYELNTSTYNDRGSAIDSYYWTKEFGGRPSDINWVKDFRWLHILYELSGGYFMNLTKRIDSLGGVGTSEQIPIDPGSSLWGVMRWGIDNWNPGAEQDEIKVSLGALSPAKRIQFKFSNQNTIDQKFKIIGLQLQYNLKGRR